MRGKIKTDSDRIGLIDYLNKLDLKRSYTWEVKRPVIRRSISQNSLYWLWLTCIQDETGNDRNDLHEYFKRRFISYHIVSVFDVECDVYSTKGLTTAQFKEYLDKIQSSMSIEGIVLPNPEDLIWDSFYEHYKDKL